MISSDWLYWLGWVGALALNILMVYLAWRGLFGDKQRHARRCPKCWYDLSATLGFRCSECGHTVEREAQLHRVRRQPRVAVLAILVAVSSILAIRWQMGQVSWTTYVPTRVLLISMPLIADPQNSLYAELNRRIARRMCSQSELESFVERAAEGDWWAQPPDEDWIKRYGNTLTSHKPTFLGTAKLEKILLDIPAAVELNTRETWPADVAPVVNLSLRDWWPTGTRSRVIITPQFKDVDGRDIEPIVAERANDNRFLVPALPLKFAALATGTHDMTFDVRIERIISNAAQDSDADADEEAHAEEPTWTLHSHRTLTVSTTIEDAATFAQAEPVSDAELDQVFATVFPGIATWTGGPAPVRMYYFPDPTFTAAFDDVAIGANVDLLYEDELVRRLSIWWMAGTKALDRNSGWESHELRPELLTQVTANDPRWTMRITGDPIIALRAGTAKKAWVGTVVVPIMRIDQRGNNAPPKAWAIENADLTAESDPPASH